MDYLGSAQTHIQKIKQTNKHQDWYQRTDRSTHFLSRRYVPAVSRAIDYTFRALYQKLKRHSLRTLNMKTLSKADALIQDLVGNAKHRMFQACVHGSHRTKSLLPFCEQVSRVLWLTISTSQKWESGSLCAAPPRSVRGIRGEPGDAISAQPA